MFRDIMDSMRVQDEKDEKRILVVIPTSTYTQRQLLEGLLTFVHKKTGDPWQLHLDLRDLNRQHLRNLDQWRCCGIIAYILNKGERNRFIGTGLPSVFIEPTLNKPLSGLPKNICQFINRHATEGETAARYFIDRHYVSFAYVGTAKETFWSMERQRGFIRRLAREKIRPFIYGGLSTAEQNDFALESRRLSRWLLSLPRLTAVFCVHDRRAQQVIASAHSVGLRVPEDIAVLGTDNDELLCEMTSPAISSIPVGDKERGFAVGQAMDDILCGRQHRKTVFSLHTSVITRRSTDVSAVTDPFVARALACATASAALPTLDDLALAAGCSRTELNRRARHSLGRTIGKEILKQRLGRCIELLENTDTPVEAIAKKHGFCGASHLGLQLKAAFGKPPSAFRTPRGPS